MYVAEQEGLMAIVGLLGKTHPSVAVIQPLLDKYQSSELYDGRDPGSEARAIREALTMIQDAGTAVPNLQGHLAFLDGKTISKPVEPEVVSDDSTEDTEVGYG